MNVKRILSGCIIVVAAMLPTIAHAEWNDSIRYKAEIHASLGDGDYSPLWLMSNQYGLSSAKSNSGYLRLGAFHDMDKSKRFTWGAGVDLAVAAGFTSVFIPQQIYGEVKYRCLNIMVGQKEIYDGFTDPELSSGSLTYSRNARPLPQVRAGIFDYANVWGCKEMFAIKGYIAYGAFTDDWWIKRWQDTSRSYTLNTLYCSRAIYFRGGNAKKFPLEGELGLEMATQFGGKTWNPSSGSWEKHPTYAKAWIKALIPMKGGSDTSYGEQTNVEGNMLGNWSASLKWEDPRGWMVRLYYQHYYEDHSMLFFDYPWKDGLFGAQAKLPKNRFVSDIVAEVLYMKDQAGPVYWDHTPEINYQISGRDGYYDHYIYNGWQHWGMGIGNPLMVSPIYNSNHNIYFYQTRVMSEHLGLKGEPSSQVGWRLLATHTRSWGVYSSPNEKVESDFSLLAEVKYHPARLKGWEGALSFAFDAGSLLGHNYGVGITISKSGFFR
jgi:hypothetical protein